MLVNSHFAALEFLQSDREKALELMAPRMQISKEELAAAYEGLSFPDKNPNRALLTGDPSPVEQSASQLSALMLRRSLLQSSPDLSNLTTAEFIPAAL